MHVLHCTCLAANAATLYAAYKADVMLNVMQVSSPSSAANKMLCIRTSGSACIAYMFKKQLPMFAVTVSSGVTDLQESD